MQLLAGCPLAEGRGACADRYTQTLPLCSCSALCCTQKPFCPQEEEVSDFVSLSQNNACQKDQEPNGRISLGKLFMWKGYCHSRGLVWLCLDLVVLESDGALHLSSKIWALKSFNFSLCSQVKGRGKKLSGERCKRICCWPASALRGIYQREG